MTKHSSATYPPTKNALQQLLEPTNLSPPTTENKRRSDWTYKSDFQNHLHNLKIQSNSISEGNMIIYVAYAAAEPPLQDIAGDNVHLMMDIKIFTTVQDMEGDETILNSFITEINQSYHHIMRRMTPQIQENGMTPMKDHNLDKYILTTICFNQKAGIFKNRDINQTLLSTRIITPKSIAIKYAITPERILDQISENLYLEKLNMQQEKQYMQG
jgi:hypothetical protein